MARLRAGDAEPHRERDGEHGHQHQLQEQCHAGGEAGAEDAFQLQSSAGHQQADRQRRAPERIRHVMPEFWQRDVRYVDGEADDAGPDQRVLHHRHHDRTRRPLFG